MMNCGVGETAVRAVTPLALTKLCGWATATTKAWHDAAAIMQDQPIGRLGLHGEGGAAAAAVTFGPALTMQFEMSRR